MGQSTSSRLFLEVGSPCSFTLWGVKVLKAPGALGTHLIFARELEHGIDVETVGTILVAAAKEANAEVLQTAFHRFTPQGVSGVVVIAESHLSIHTWPEYGYAAMDIYTCGEKTDPWKACRYAAGAFHAKQMLTTEVRRGMTNEDGVYTHTVGRRTAGAEPVAKNRKLSVVR